MEFYYEGRRIQFFSCKWPHHHHTSPDNYSNTALLILISLRIFNDEVTLKFTKCHLKLKNCSSCFAAHVLYFKIYDSWINFSPLSLKHLNNIIKFSYMLIFLSTRIPMSCQRLRMKESLIFHHTQTIMINYKRLSWLEELITENITVGEIKSRAR
jgi:hypothetical protein